MVFEPPAATAIGAFDANAAYAQYSNQPRVGNGPMIFLARPRKHPGVAGNHEGSVRDEGDATLVYILRWEDVPMVFSGPAPGPGGWEPRSVVDPPVSRVGVWIGIVNAANGETLGTYRTNDPAA
jgi:hypothetical protein